MTTPHFPARAWAIALAALAVSALGASAGRTGSALTSSSSDSSDIALAVTAAPASLSGAASVYLWRNGDYVKVRDGTNGFACLIQRDSRGTVAPMCFDPEGTRTLMQEIMLQARLQSRGLTNETVQHEIDAAYAKGTLQHADHGGMIYMMSSKQLLPSSKEANAQLSAWHPHVMIFIPHATQEQFALGADNKDGLPVSAPFKGDDGGTLLVVQVPHWADEPAVASR
jgi:hypothetical protein